MYAFDAMMVRFLKTRLRQGSHFHRRSLWGGLALLFMTTVAGTLGFMWIEGWSLADGLYMTIITISTVGYGEIAPLSSAGRMFASALIVGGLGTAIYTFTRLGQAVLEGELIGGIGRRRMQRELKALSNHYIVCGFGRAAKPVTEGLAHKKLPFCVIESDPKLESSLVDRALLYLIDDATSDEALEQAGIDKANAVITLLPSDADNLYVTVTAKALNPSLRVIARAVDERGELKLKRGGADEVISPYELASHPILQAATSPAVLQFMKHVTDRNYLEMSLVEALVANDSSLNGTSLKEAQFRSEFGVTVVAIRRADGTMLFNPDPAVVLAADDVVVLMGRNDSLFRVERALGRR